MKLRARTVRDERGVALPLALFTLVMLSGLLLAFLTMSGMESEISANLSEVARARYVAEAGIEWSYDQLVSNTNWNGVLIGPDNIANTADDGLLVNNQTLPAPLNDAALGTFTVRVRNDNQNGDAALTGLAACNAGGASDCGPNLPTATNDNNGVVIVTATGTYRGITRQIQVVLRRLNLPPFAGAYNAPGSQADLAYNNIQFQIDGRDYVSTCTAKCSEANPLDRTYSYSLNTDPKAKLKYGIAVSPGYQENLCSGACDGVGDTTLEQRAELKLDTAQKRANVTGKDQTNPATWTTGLNTVYGIPANDPDSMGAFVTLPDPNPDAVQTTPKKMNDFLTQLAKFSATKIYQSNLACAENIGGVPVGIRMIGNGSSKYANLVTIKNQCGMNQQIDLGTVDKPAMVYFRGDLDPTSSFAGVKTEGAKIKGAGILIVEDGDFRISNQFEWDGIVVVTGRYVTLVWESGSSGQIYGAGVANETAKCESGGTGCSNPASGTLWDTVFNSSGPALIRYSQQNLDLVQRRLLFRMSTWREL